MVPMRANWQSHSGFASTFAPRSRKSFGPFCVGSIAASGGLCTPGSLPTISCPAARIAPVEPAETKAEAFPSLTRRAPTARLESFFFLTAATGDSSVVITSEAGMMLTRSCSSLLHAPTASRIVSSGPARSRKISLSACRAS